MALDTPKNLRNQVLYSVFVRQYSSEGTFEALRRDLDRIQALGADILWLMPIHPIGAQGRKGTVGSPYAIRDYRAVDPALGTLDDFRRLVGDLHARGMENRNHFFGKDALVRFRIFAGKLDRLGRRTANLRDYTTQVRESYQAQVDIELNKIMLTIR